MNTWYRTGSNLPRGVEVLGFHPDWIHPDFNPAGIRMGVFYIDSEEFVCAKWNNDQDGYFVRNTHYPEAWMFVPDSPATDSSIHYQDYLNGQGNGIL